METQEKTIILISLILVIQIILDHLTNWWFRKEDENMKILIIIIAIVEFTLMLTLYYEVLK